MNISALLKFPKLMQIGVVHKDHVIPEEFPTPNVGGLYVVTPNAGVNVLTLESKLITLPYEDIFIFMGWEDDNLTTMPIFSPRLETKLYVSIWVLSQGSIYITPQDVPGGFIRDDYLIYDFNEGDAVAMSDKML